MFDGTRGWEVRCVARKIWHLAQHPTLTLDQSYVPCFSSPFTWVLSQETPYFFSLWLAIGITKAKSVELLLFFIYLF